MKVSGSYPSVVQGVSQQKPQNRRPGQCTEQVNMQPDPVRGLARRHGSRFQAEKNLGAVASAIDAMTADTLSFKTLTYTNGGSEYVLQLRRGAKTPGSALPPVLAYNRTSKAFLNYVRNPVDASLDLLESGGISAAVSVGKYVFLAGNTLLPSATSVDLWQDPTNRTSSVVWVRGGAYSRTYTVKATKADNTLVTFSYATPTSSYQGTLDTSVVPPYAGNPAGGTTTEAEAAYIRAVGAYGEAQLGWSAWNPTAMSVKNGTTTLTNVSPANPANATQYSWAAGASFVRFHASLVGSTSISMTYTHTATIDNPNYSKAVADLQNAYNSAVTQWIGTAADAIQPQAIAAKLQAAAIAAGLTGASLVGSHVILDGIISLSVDDGGDGSLIRGVANEVTSIDQVSDVHRVGKVIKVRTRGSEEAFYLTAISKSAAITSGYTEVTWIEGAAIKNTITGGLVYATVSAGSIYVASSATLLAAILPGTHPDYVGSSVGDDDTSPLPYFIGKRIGYLGTFQDRLVIGSDAVVRVSKIGDYLNFFRSSVLTVISDDPFEMLSQGGEDDELHYSVLYDRDLILFGDKRQYAVSGRSPLTPTGANMPVMSSHADSATSPPIAVGGLIFYLKLGEGSSSSVHQMEPSLNAESPDAYLISSQLDTYIKGDALEMVAHAKPAALVIRTSGDRNGLVTFHYLDAGGEGRKQDAWNRWSFSPTLGPVTGVTSTPNGILVFTLRTVGANVWLVADLVPMDSVLSDLPYLDSIRPWAQVGTGSLLATDPGEWAAAYAAGTTKRFRGSALADSGDFLAGADTSTVWAGALYEAYYVPTNPFVLDRNGKAIVSGRLTLTSLKASTSESSGLIFETTDVNGSRTISHNGRRLGDPNNILGQVPVTDQEISNVVGKEVRECSCKFLAHTWLPLTITSLEWVGQWLNNVRRF